MTLDTTLKGMLIAGLLSAGSAEAPDRERSAHELAYAANSSQELMIDEAGFDRLDEIARNGTIDLEHVVEPVDVRSDGSGTYRIEGAIAYIEHESARTSLKDLDSVDDTNVTRTFYEPTGTPFYSTDVQALGSTPLDAISALISAPQEGAHIRYLGEHRERLITMNGIPVEEETQYEQHDTTLSHASGIAASEIEVHAIKDGNKTLGFQAYAPVLVYGQPE